MTVMNHFMTESEVTVMVWTMTAVKVRHYLKQAWIENTINVNREVYGAIVSNSKSNRLCL
jgi:hypothetical protein